MIETASPNGAQSPVGDSDSVSAIVGAYLPQNPEGANAVRCVIARRLAHELDSDPPAYVVPRLAGALATVIDEIDGTHSNGKVSLRELLGPLVTS